MVMFQSQRQSKNANNNEALHMVNVMIILTKRNDVFGVQMASYRNSNCKHVTQFSDARMTLRLHELGQEWWLFIWILRTHLNEIELEIYLEQL